MGSVICRRRLELSAGSKPTKDESIGGNGGSWKCMAVKKALDNQDTWMIVLRAGSGVRCSSVGNAKNGEERLLNTAGGPMFVSLINIGQLFYTRQRKFMLATLTNASSANKSNIQNADQLPSKASVNGPFSIETLHSSLVSLPEKMEKPRGMNSSTRSFCILCFRHFRRSCTIFRLILRCRCV